MVMKFARKYSEILEALEKLETAVQLSYHFDWMIHVTNMFGTIVGGHWSCGRAPQHSNFTLSVSRLK